MQKLDGLHEAFMSCTDTKRKAFQTDAIRKFDEMYKLVSNKYVEQLLQEAQNSKQNGKLTGKRLAELESLSNRGRSAVDREFIDRISSIINPKEKRQVSRLLCNLAVEDNLEEARNYEIFRANVGNRKLYVYKRQGTIVGTDEYGLGEGTILGTNEDFNRDFTLELEENATKIIRDFSNLRDKILSRDPNAEIRIMERFIIVNSEYGERCYMIQNGGIEPAILDAKSKIKVNLDPESRDLPDINRNGIFSKAKQAIMRKFLRKPSQGVVYGGTPKNPNPRRRGTNFKEQISDMSNYSKPMESKVEPEIEYNDVESQIEEK